uniref:Uncharacterized protein n=1 Tax=Rhodnius prolixus TaxID=13249 RepID=T1I058_RHOPR
MCERALARLMFFDAVHSISCFKLPTYCSLVSLPKTHGKGTSRKELSQVILRITGCRKLEQFINGTNDHFSQCSNYHQVFLYLTRDLNVGRPSSTRPTIKCYISGFMQALFTDLSVTVY